MSEFLGIFAFSGAVCAIFWVWVFIETYGERKRDKAGCDSLSGSDNTV